MLTLLIKYDLQRIATKEDIKNYKATITNNVIQVGKSDIFVEQRFVSGKPTTKKIEGCKVYRIINNNIEVGYYKGGFIKSSLWTNRLGNTNN